MKSICLFILAVLFVAALSLMAYQAEIRKTANDFQPYTHQNMLKDLEK
jgi:hypothetical protein